ncbi:MAG: hypothetical protein RL748_641 [Pseudomonadota bacterium]|jgi:uncharacterized protein (DUF3820 family)
MPGNTRTIAGESIPCQSNHFQTHDKPISMQAQQLEKLLKWEMPYGKYKGRLLADLPGHYLGWMARAGFPPGELGSLLALMYELDHNDLRSLLQPLRQQK